MMNVDIEKYKNIEDVVLELKNITKIYKKGKSELKALDDISFKVKRGEFLGIVGESGSGKSTIAKQITRLETPTDGQIILNNEDITNLKDRKIKKIYKDMQMIFQDPVGCFDPKMKIGKSIEELLAINKFPKEARKQRVLELMKLVGLSGEHADKYPSQLSGGQCQRAAIARALATEPSVLICDEITSDLDVSIQGQIISLLMELKEKNDITYLFICHDLALVELLCDNVIVVHKGRIVEYGNAKEVINNPLHPYTKLLLNSIFPLKNKGWSIPDVLGEEASLDESKCKFYSRCKARNKNCLGSAPKLLKINENHFVACCNVN